MMRQSLKISLIGALLWFLVFACVTEKKRAKICAACPQTSIVKDSITEKVTPFDTLLFISQNGNAISLPYLKYPLQIVDSLNKLLAKHNGTVSTNNAGIVTTITRSNGRIHFSCKADSLAYLLKIERAKTVRTVVKTIFKEVPKHCPECTKPHKSGFDAFLRWLFIIIIIGGLILLKNLPTVISYYLNRFKNK